MSLLAVGAIALASFIFGALSQRIANADRDALMRKEIDRLGKTMAEAFAQPPAEAGSTRGEP